MTGESLYLMDSTVDSSLATEGFPEAVCQSKLSPGMCEEPKVTQGQTKERSCTGGDVRVLI